jgi:hypothetical protein
LVIPINEPYISHHVSPALGESAIITLHSYRRDAPDYFLSDRYAEAWRAPLRTLVLARLAAQADAISERHSLRDPLAVIKEPNGSLGADLVMSLFPRSRLILLLRDGRDVVDSMLDAQAPGAWLATLQPAPRSSQGSTPGWGCGGVSSGRAAPSAGTTSTHTPPRRKARGSRCERPARDCGEST